MTKKINIPRRPPITGQLFFTRENGVYIPHDNEANASIVVRLFQGGMSCPIQDGDIGAALGALTAAAGNQDFVFHQRGKTALAQFVQG